MCYLSHALRLCCALPQDAKESASDAHMEMIEKADEEAAEDAKKKDAGKEDTPKKVSAQDKP